MASNNQTKFEKDLASGKVTVTHQCDADVETVWEMWTRPELLDLWWAPKPWKSETRSMDFKNGGRRFYAMVGPDNERQWGIDEFSNIVARKSFEMKDMFSDENQVINKDMPSVDWKVAFDKAGDGTKITVKVAGSPDDLKKLVEMGFEEGFKMALVNLDEELAAHTAKR